MCKRSVFVVAVLATAMGCGSGDDGGGEGGADASVIALTDGAPPDAPPPDALVCPVAECGGVCVNTQTDRDHCGSCGKTCSSPALDCSGGECGDCPASFVPEPFTTAFDFVQENMGSVFAVGAFAGGDGATHAVIVFADPAEVELGVDLDLATATSVGVFLGYRVDLMSMQAQSSYAALSGTLRIDALCADGLTATLTGASFQEAELGGPVIPESCQLADVSIDLALGSDCSPSE